MRVHLIKKQTIQDFCVEHPQSRASLSEWLAKVKLARWSEPRDVKATFGSADLLGRGSCSVVFDVAGNRYRIIARYVFGEKQVHLFVCWTGAHSEYDSIYHEQKQYTIVYQ